MKPTLAYLRWPIALTVLGLALAFWLGLNTSGTLAGGFSFLLIGSVLAVLEISLSFDNAIVNANKLKTMTPEWQRRFLTWGILIAVFGMRLVFPLAVVSIAARIDPVSAVLLAVAEPEAYARTLGKAQLSISAFGGCFLMMVALTYFIDQEKDVHWVQVVEAKLRAWSSLRGVELAIVLLLAMAFTMVLPDGKSEAFLFASVAGLLTFLAVELVGQALDAAEATRSAAAKGGLGAFLYLEVLDASFSFDGVVGAFALTHNLFLIMIGLGIGALYVRSMTIMLVDRQTLAAYRYLEHGAFWAILILAVIMYAQALVHIPEVITGLAGAALIAVSLWSSVRHNARAGAST